MPTLSERAYRSCLGCGRLFNVETEMAQFINHDCDKHEDVDEEVGTLLTSSQWTALLSEKGVIVLDADGWDRKNFEHSWYEEKISLEEWVERASRSTVDAGKLNRIKVVLG